ncbi:enoyl-CoA hydratase/isomerase family protein [Bacterioplanoides sp. SCSIO 12839]|uniref:enoyl-CoA hydratase/isomerase family protein n=1 Tax=Bacterioplanoides sp. SCSIO 12839 TaxID=2829569 RepID=UPI002106F0D8|nr:enoyl-CoA hydratase/isomerase family protein [Bacterioplanoides sp. SCSIO 12839]UTW48780.1 enoyl-CoA hydratase/isomerase family protein [Bacterioplanoides sp. SCSIO 12839]
MTEIISLEQQGSVAVVTMNTDENRHNLEFISAFNACLDAVEKDQKVGSMVLTSSSEKNWSLGVDLTWVSQKTTSIADSVEFMQGMDAIFKRMLTFPVPIIAAMNGHVFGNGSVLACACDFRFMKSDRGYFCFPEVDVLVPFLPSMIPLIHQAMSPQFFNRLAMTGQRVGAQELLDNQVVEAVFDDNEALQAGVMEFAAQFKKNRWIYAENKKQKNQETLAVMADKDPAFIEKSCAMMGKMMGKA